MFYLVMISFRFVNGLLGRMMILSFVLFLVGCGNDSLDTEADNHVSVKLSNELSSDDSLDGQADSSDDNLVVDFSGKIGGVNVKLDGDISDLLGEDDGIERLKELKALNEGSSSIVCEFNKLSGLLAKDSYAICTMSKSLGASYVVNSKGYVCSFSKQGVVNNGDFSCDAGVEHLKVKDGDVSCNIDFDKGILIYSSSELLCEIDTNTGAVKKEVLK